MVLAVVLVSARGYCESCGGATQAPKEFGGIVSGVASMSAVVESIDAKTREVTLKDAEGKVATIVCGPEVRNFDQIKVGDKVNMDYSQTVKLLVSPKVMAPARQDSMEVFRAKLGEKPAGVATATTQVTATVENIDYVKRTVVLKGPERTMEIQLNADADAPNFNKIKIGDTVYLEYTESLAISVTK
jgi:hypothetical protein